MSDFRGSACTTCIHFVVVRVFDLTLQVPYKYSTVQLPVLGRVRVQVPVLYKKIGKSTGRTGTSTYCTWSTNTRTTGTSKYNLYVIVVPLRSTSTCITTVHSSYRLPWKPIYNRPVPLLGCISAPFSCHVPILLVASCCVLWLLNFNKIGVWKEKGGLLYIEPSRGTVQLYLRLYVILSTVLLRLLSIWLLARTKSSIDSARKTSSLSK
jgi:hypothetical protein